MLLQQNPIVVEVARQPEATPGISYVSVLGSAALMSIVIFVVAIAVGLGIGGVIIWRKKRRERTAEVAPPSHVQLKLG
jgi:hypothetical protein